MTNHAVSNRADLRERTKTMSRHGDRRGQIADFRDSFETINWLYLLFKCGTKTKTHFEWLLWHWSSLGQLNLEPTRPGNGLVGCKVPTDLVKISVKETTHMGFHYTISYIMSWGCMEHQCSRPTHNKWWNKWNLKCDIIITLKLTRNTCITPCNRVGLVHQFPALMPTRKYCITPGCVINLWGWYLGVLHRGITKRHNIMFATWVPFY